MTLRPAGWSFGDRTAPFFDRNGAEPARFVLEQLGDDRFAVREPFVYDDGEVRVRVPLRDEVASDLASIPFFMAWFVPVNGRHTPSALVHDTLLAEIAAERRAGDLDGAGYLERRLRADEVFRRAMEASGVPLLRRELMFAAVTLATRWSRGATVRGAVVCWVVLSVLGSVALLGSLVAGAWAVTAAAVVAPLPAALLWGPGRLRPGVLAGYATWLIGLPALATALGYGIYWCAEQALRPLAARGSGEPVAQSPPPAPYR